MNASGTEQSVGDFASRLEAELVKVVTARVSTPPGQGHRAVTVVSRPAVWAGALAAGFAVALAAGFAFGGLPLSQRSAPAASGGANAGAGHIRVRTAAFTVNSSVGGAVRVTWYKSQYIKAGQDSAALQQALRQAGFPVLIKEGVFCAGPHDSAAVGPGGVGSGVDRVMRGESQPDGDVVFTFTPSAMPPGEELFIGFLSPSQLAVTGGRPGSVERLVPAGVPLTCTSRLPLPRSS
jgi:hypothetical protein